MMILIFGGYYQGKLAYALEKSSMTESDVYGCSEHDAITPSGQKIIYELDKWLLALVKEGLDTDKEVEKLIAKNSDAIVICNDISCGIVPIDRELRKWRESVGKALTRLARESGEVIRVFCGIPTILKEKL